MQLCSVGDLIGADSGLFIRQRSSGGFHGSRMRGTGYVEGSRFVAGGWDEDVMGCGGLCARPFLALRLRLMLGSAQNPRS